MLEIPHLRTQSRLAPDGRSGIGPVPPWHGHRLLGSAPDVPPLILIAPAKFPTKAAPPRASEPLAAVVAPRLPPSPGASAIILQSVSWCSCLMLSPRRRRRPLRAAASS